MKISNKNYIQQLKKHNEDALVYVINTYGGLLKSVIRKMLFTMPEKQEECLNDVLLNIWENIGSYQEEKNSFQNWAAAVAKYRAIDYLRRYRKEMEMHCVAVEEIEIPKEDAMLEQLIERELSEELEKMLRCLTPLDRQLFMKLYAEEKSVGQVSEETGLEVSAIYNHISRGKKKIRKGFLVERGI